MISRPTSICRTGFVKTEFHQVELVDKNINHSHRIGILDVIVEAFGQ